MDAIPTVPKDDENIVCDIISELPIIFDTRWMLNFYQLQLFLVIYIALLPPQKQKRIIFHPLTFSIHIPITYDELHIQYNAGLSAGATSTDF